jgi:hypothetical protein
LRASSQYDLGKLASASIVRDLSSVKATEGPPVWSVQGVLTKQNITHIFS